MGGGVGWGGGGSGVVKKNAPGEKLLRFLKMEEGVFLGHSLIIIK